MIGRIVAIARNTFREAIRNKVLYGILVAVVGANLFALVLGEMSLGEEGRVARDVGLAGVSLFGALTAIALGVTLVYNEVQRKTIHTILAKPLERHEFVIGKYGGIAVTLTLLVACFALALVGLLLLVRTVYPEEAVALGGTLGRALVLAYLEVLVVAAIAIFFSTFTSPYLSGIFTFALFFLGRVSPELRLAAEGAKAAWIRVVARAGLTVVPDLHTFAVSGSQLDGQHVSVHGTFVTWGYVGWASVYALAWIAGLLLLAALIFRRRDFV